MEYSTSFYRLSKILFTTTFFFDLGDPINQFGTENYFMKKAGSIFNQLKTTKHSVTQKDHVKVKLTSMILNL